jgi:hypothetical protein
MVKFEQYLKESSRPKTLGTLIKYHEGVLKILKGFERALPAWESKMNGELKQYNVSGEMSAEVSYDSILHIYFSVPHRQAAGLDTLLLMTLEKVTGEGWQKKGVDRGNLTYYTRVRI